MVAYGGMKIFEQKHMDFSSFLPNGDILCLRKSIKNSSHHLDIFALKKRLASKTNNLAIPQNSVEKQFKQALKIRSLFNRGNEDTKKKRKLEQYIRGDKLTASGIEFRKYDSHNVKELVTGQSNDTSCITNLIDTTKGFSMHPCNSSSSSVGFNSYQKKQELSNFIRRNSNQNPSLSSVNIRSTISIDEKVCVFDQDSVEALEDVNSMNIIDLEEIDLSSSEELKSTRRPAFSLLMFKGEYLPRPEVPIGLSFQAEIPPLIARNDYIRDDTFRNSRWLGSQVWPIESDCTKKYQEAIGKGRVDNCSCKFPRSPNCIKQHIAMSREILAFNLGPAFSMWKFDEIGQQVLRTWTPKEEDCFAHLINKNPLVSVANFWDKAIKHLPRKCKKSIISYYYNVFIPRRMSNQFQSSLDYVVSDDDELEDNA